MPLLFNTVIFQIFIIRNAYLVNTAAGCQFDDAVGRGLHQLMVMGRK